MTSEQQALVEMPIWMVIVLSLVGGVFSYMPNMPITVQGDVKDPQQVFRSLEGMIRNSWETWSRESLARQASGQLFDQPHV